MAMNARRMGSGPWGRALLATASTVAVLALGCGADTGGAAVSSEIPPCEHDCTADDSEYPLDRSDPRAQLPLEYRRGWEFQEANSAPAPSQVRESRVGGTVRERLGKGFTRLHHG